MKIDDVVVGVTYALKTHHGRLAPAKVLQIDKIPQRTYSSGFMGRPGTRNVRRPLVELLEEQPHGDQRRHVQPQDLVGPWAEHAAEVARKRAQEREAEDAMAALEAKIEEFYRIETKRYYLRDGGGVLVRLYLTPTQAKALAERIGP